MSLFILLMFFDMFAGTIAYFLPLIIFGLIGFSFANMFKVLSRTNTNNRRTNVNYQKSSVKTAKIAGIDKVLKDYYKDNVSLVLLDEDITLSTQNGTYSTVNDLYICFKDEKICKLSELQETYPTAYDKIIEKLRKYDKKTIRNLEKEEKKRLEEAKKKEGLKSEKKKEASTAEGFIDQINSLNQGLSNEEVTNGLYQTCDVLKQIDIVDMEDGKVDAKLNKLYEYYLPILTGILENYKRLSESPVKGDEFKKCETQLVKTIKLINEALKIIYNSLHEADYMNLNADISTLQSLLKQDGYGDTPFKEE